MDNMNDEKITPTPEEPGDAEILQPKDYETVEVPQPVEVPTFESTPIYGEPVLNGEAPHFETSTPGSTPPVKKNNRTIWIIVIVIVALLCCCCIALVVIGVRTYNSNEWQDLYNQYNWLIPTVTGGFI